MHQAPQIFGWKWTRRLPSIHAFECWQCEHSTLPGIFLAKILLSESLSDLQRFEREVFLRTSLGRPFGGPVVEYDLDSHRPYLIVPEFVSLPLDDWLRTQSMQPPPTVLMWIARQILQILERIHQLGYVHASLQPDQVLIAANGDVRLSGLESCRLVGDHSGAPLASSRYASPEIVEGDCELSSSQDVYSLAIMVSDLLGREFLESPMGRMMTSRCPDQRPTSSDLLPLFLDLEMNLFGQQIAA